MNSLSNRQMAQFVMVRSPMTFVMGGHPSRAAACLHSSNSALRMAFRAIADAVKVIPISALHARNQQDRNS